jgi:hypothetical protein
MTATVHDLQAYRRVYPVKRLLSARDRLLAWKNPALLERAAAAGGCPKMRCLLAVLMEAGYAEEFEIELTDHGPATAAIVAHSSLIRLGKLPS